MVLQTQGLYTQSFHNNSPLPQKAVALKGGVNRSKFQASCFVVTVEPGAAIKQQYH